MQKKKFELNMNEKMRNNFEISISVAFQISKFEIPKSNKISENNMGQIDNMQMFGPHLWFVDLASNRMTDLIQLPIFHS